jgi:hypothetical protein
MAKTDSRTREAKYGEKMIEVKLRFWTDQIADEPGHVIPKHAWGFGVARMEKNKSHGIVPGDPIHFHSLMEIGSVVEKVLVAHGITLHVPPRMQKYLVDE